jgi:type II secretory ATPase GspE/PulE/Tfp pilus assembly ATPase PilB-like protein
MFGIFKKQKDYDENLNQNDMATLPASTFVDAHFEKIMTEFDVSTYGEMLQNDRAFEKYASYLGKKFINNIDDFKNEYENDLGILSNDKLHLSNEHYIIPLTLKKNRNYKIIAVRDIYNVEKMRKILITYYFDEIVLFGNNILSDVFGNIDKTINFDPSNENNDMAIDDYLNNVLKEAVVSGVSDIHIETTKSNCILWYRADGKKRIKGKMSKKIGTILKRRIAILAEQEDDELKSINGVIRTNVAGKETELRVNIINTVHDGFSIVLRITAGKAAVDQSFEGLNYDPVAVGIIKKAIKYYNGLILITGQTGSGKTTVMYACLTELMKQDKNICTVEEPVEIEIDKMNQVDLTKFNSATEEYKYTYSDAIVDFLRQDPDVILVGETRTEEVAKQAIIASNTGHLVFTTLHTNSVHSSIQRMTGLGVDIGDIEDNVRMILSQRLVDKVCQACAIPDGNGGKKGCGHRLTNTGTITDDVCAFCKGRKHAGRVPVYEIALYKLGHGGMEDGIIEYISYEESAKNQYLRGLIDIETTTNVEQGLS